MPNLKSFSLYLAKADVKAFDTLLTDTARAMVRAGEAKSHTSSRFGDGAALYVFPGRKQVPKWVPLLRSAFANLEDHFARSPCALLLFQRNSHIFALTFSYAHVYLDDAKTEADFGLKVAVNAVSDEKLRSVERANIGAAIRDFAQAVGQRDLRSFGVDDALDLIRKVSGRVEDSDFAQNVTGSRGLRFSKKVELVDVPDAALEALRLFKSKAYRNTGFRFIDFLSPVLDTTLEEKLNGELLSAIRGNSDEFEVALPDIVSENITFFRFEHAGFSDFYPDLSLDLYRGSLGSRLPSLLLEDLERHTIAAYSENENRPIQSWSVHRALIGSLVLSDERYALNEGRWYQVGKNFKDAADRKFAELYGAPDKKLRPLKKVVISNSKGKKQKIGYQSEESYNREIAQEAGYLLLDQKLIQIDEVPGPGIEMCDLLDIEGRRFIHVKKSSRQSSILSHFFKQGGVSAQLLRKYEPFRIKLVETVKQLYGAQTAQELKVELQKRWTVEFQIADFPRADGTHNIPFFSKLTLREESRDIEAMDFDVSVKFINLTRITPGT
ncbi:DUF6119 family protein [Bradyrhizobium sp. DASA03120]|uniref:DUF6119 family protein n=1 Tax=Bradyrhizobium sp. SMVTL-02 TaxID=3395917 RepID=UPI003F72FA6B